VLFQQLQNWLRPEITLDFRLRWLGIFHGGSIITICECGVCHHRHQ
jgi:hypothetical protein